MGAISRSARHFRRGIIVVRGVDSLFAKKCPCGPKAQAGPRMAGVREAFTSNSQGCHRSIENALFRPNYQSLSSDRAPSDSNHHRRGTLWACLPLGFTCCGTSSICKGFGTGIGLLLIRWPGNRSRSNRSAYSPAWLPSSCSSARVIELTTSLVP